MQHPRRFAFAGVVILAAACGTSGPTTSIGGGPGLFPGSISVPPGLSPAGIELPTYGPGDAYPDALATGTLERRGGCVVLHGTTDHLLIWPAGTTAWLDEAGLVVVEPTGPALREHQLISVGGGEYAEADFPRPITGLDGACQSYPLWLAAPPES